MSVAALQNDPAITLRPPETVMRLARMGAFHQTRLSFMRSLLRRLKRENWSFVKTLWEIDREGNGVAVYEARGPERTYSLIAFANDLDPSKRSDRVIAEEWDATFTLFDGVPDRADLERLSKNVPKQEAGRISGRELSLSRANRSVRLFNYVRDCLADGRQPEPCELDKVGYIMRTTAVYGNAKFGACDRTVIADRPEFSAPFQAELLSVFMTRAFTFDSVEHMARMQNPDKAVALDPALCRRLGVGNSTGLGMAPFIVNHPSLLNNWIVARETALARVRALPEATPADLKQFRDIVARQKFGVRFWSTDHPGQATHISRYRDDLALLQDHINAAGSDWSLSPHPWDRLYLWGETALSLEGQESLVGMLLEPHGDLVDDLADTMSADEAACFEIDGTLKIAELRRVLQMIHGDGLNIDFSDRLQSARFWYASEEKLEPRLGDRYDEDGSDREHPLATVRDAAALYHGTKDWNPDQPIAGFLLQHPEHRHSVRRAQIANAHPYAEIRDNLIAADMLPIDLLRCKLSFFGAIKFDPRSDRWVRITLFQHAPLPSDLDMCATEAEADDWAYAPLDFV